MELALICDEITALGWRLAGAHVHVPAPEAAGESLRSVAASAEVVLITADLAAHVPPEQLEVALRAARPLLLVIGDLRRRREPADPAQAVHHALGIAL